MSGERIDRALKSPSVTDIGGHEPRGTARIDPAARLFPHVDQADRCAFAGEKERARPADAPMMTAVFP